MANIMDNGTHFTFRSRTGSIGDSFFFFTHWYGGNYVLVTRIQGKVPAEHSGWLGYLDKNGIEHELLGTACLVMPGSTEQLFVEDVSFTGDSEIYVCHKRPSADAVPRASYPAGEYDFSDGPPEGFLEDMRRLDALVYMSDGGGVNIAHKAKEEIIFFVKEMSMGG